MFRIIGIILSFIGHVFLFYYAFEFIKWYIKMHFNLKWFWVFWLNTFLSAFIYINHHNKPIDPIDTKSGYELWQEKYNN